MQTNHKKKVGLTMKNLVYFLNQKKIGSLIREMHIVLRENTWAGLMLALLFSQDTRFLVRRSAMKILSNKYLFLKIHDQIIHYFNCANTKEVIARIKTMAQITERQMAEILVDVEKEVFFSKEREEFLHIFLEILFDLKSHGIDLKDLESSSSYFLKEVTLRMTKGDSKESILEYFQSEILKNTMMSIFHKLDHQEIQPILDAVPLPLPEDIARAAQQLVAKKKEAEVMRHLQGSTESKLYGVMIADPNMSDQLMHSIRQLVKS